MVHPIKDGVGTWRNGFMIALEELVLEVEMNSLRTIEVEGQERVRASNCSLTRTWWEPGNSGYHRRARELGIPNEDLPGLHSFATPFEVAAALVQHTGQHWAPLIGQPHDNDYVEAWMGGFAIHTMGHTFLFRQQRPRKYPGMMVEAYTPGLQVEVRNGEGEPLWTLCHEMVHGESDYRMGEKLLPEDRRVSVPIALEDIDQVIREVSRYEHVLSSVAPTEVARVLCGYIDLNGRQAAEFLKREPEWLALLQKRDLVPLMRTDQDEATRRAARILLVQMSETQGEEDPIRVHSLLR